MIDCADARSVALSLFLSAELNHAWSKRVRVFDEGERALSFLLMGFLLLHDFAFSALFKNCIFLVYWRELHK